MDNNAMRAGNGRGATTSTMYFEVETVHPNVGAFFGERLPHWNGCEACHAQLSTFQDSKAEHNAEEGLLGTFVHWNA